MFVTDARDPSIAACTAPDAEKHLGVLPGARQARERVSAPNQDVSEWIRFNLTASHQQAPTCMRGGFVPAR
ncbi:hypothetical protein A5780_01910 [Nocardia sp. 852002-20019_SCH5090214]|nr:hypothetical protein A5780_01910 [Nocardia sp. 852002-20019_SCH5090214]